MSIHLKEFNPEDVTIVYHTELVAPRTVFTDASGREWYAITGSVGYVNQFGIPLGMVTDPQNPEPWGAVTAVPVDKVELVSI